MTPNFKAFCLGLVAALALFLYVAAANAVTYDAQEAKGYPRLSDADSLTVPLYSIYVNGNARVDSVRLPKPPADIQVLGCIRLAPSPIAQCLIGMKSLGTVFAKEVPLNFTES